MKMTSERASFFIGGSIFAVLRSFLLLMQDYNVAYGAKRALKRMKRTRKEFTPTSRYKSTRLSESLYYFNNKEQGEADFVI